MAGGQRLDLGLIDSIYEAAVLPDTWGAVLQDLADRVGAAGSAFITQSRDRVQWVASPSIERTIDDFFREGWAADPERVAPLLAEQYPGFRAEIDYRTAEEIARLPVHVEFTGPRGLMAGAGTIIQGARNDALLVSFEGFASHDAARDALPFLNDIRPHLSRALSLTALQAERSRIIVDSLALGGVAAAVIGGDGHLRSANEPFTRRMGDLMIDARSGLRFADRFLDDKFAAALGRHRVHQGQVQSIAVRDPAGGLPFVIHMLPIKGAAREVCEADGVLLLVADAMNASIPNADLLRLLFDLTPAEARLTRALLEGSSLAEAARTFGTSEQTVRVQLRGVFAKTGLSRQADLVRLLMGFGSPAQ